jgi:hypothetical protein
MKNSRTMTTSKRRTAVTQHEMKPRRRRQALVTLAACLMFSAATAAAGATAPPTAGVIHDDFSDGNFTDKPSWTVDSGRFEVRGGELVFGPDKDTKIHLDIRDHPNLLGNVWTDEPTGNFWGKDMEGRFKAFLDYKSKANRIAPNLRVFINDVPWIDPPATPWWTKWNTAGDVSCHDNYPVKHSAQTRSISAIADTVGLAVKVNDQKKPVCG